MLVCKLHFRVFFLIINQNPMVNQIETFGLNVHMHEGFDCDDVHLESKNLVEVSRQVVGLISTTSGPSAFESITTPSDLYEEVEIAWEDLKVQFIMNNKAWVFHHKLFFS
jgi:hypothetical protein